MPTKELYQRFKLEGKCTCCGNDRDSIFTKCSKCRKDAQNWKKKNADSVRIQQKEYFKRNPDKQKVTKLRLEILEILGKKCIRCGYSENIHALCIDHVKGHGRLERKEFKNAQRFYEHILQKVKEGSKDYQTLCANCNAIKRFENKEC